MKRFAIITLIICLFLLPYLIRSEYLLQVLILSCIYGVLAASWDLMIGYTGIISFGHPAFFGMGGYVSALLSIHLGISPWLGIFIGGLSAGALGFVIGLPTLKLKGVYVGIVTMSFDVILVNICTNWESLTKGAMGLWDIPTFPEIKVPGLLNLDFSGTSRVNHYYLILIIMLLSLYTMRRISKSKIGLFLLGIREDEMAVEAMGVNTRKYRIMVFVITSFIVGIVGSFYAHYILVLTPGDLSFYQMINVLAMTLLGGWRTLLGPVIGAFFLTFIGEFLREFGDYRLVLYGMIIIAVILFMPKGILGWVLDFASRTEKALRKKKTLN